MITIHPLGQDRKLEFSKVHIANKIPDHNHNCVGKETGTVADR